MSDKMPESIPFNNGFLFVYGYGVKIRTRNNYLVIDDGICENRRSAQFHAISGLKRVVVQSTDGYITLDALDWFAKNRVGFLHLNEDGDIITTSHVGNAPKPTLRRAQALAVVNGSALGLAKALIGAKLDNQAATLSDRATSERIRNLRDAMQTCSSFDDIRLIESQAASLYFDALSDVAITFNRKDCQKIPAHWRTFGKRSSDYTKCPRAATNPINAMLNYLYAILEGECLIALSARGFDPGLGILHSDSATHSAFVYDAMEPLRPLVDSLLLAILRNRTFAKSDFLDTEHGIVRMASAIRKLLTESFYAHNLHSEIARTVDGLVSHFASERVALS